MSIKVSGNHLHRPAVPRPLRCGFSLFSLVFRFPDPAPALAAGVTVRRVRLEGTTSGLTFELVTDVQDGATAEEAPFITRCQLTVPLEVQAELASFTKSVERDRVLTVALRGLAKFAHASQERQRLFERLQKGYPEWITLPHGSLATPLLTVRPPVGSHADLVFDFLWQMEVSGTGALEHVAALVPHVTQEFVNADNKGLLDALPGQFKKLTVLKGLEGAFEVMMGMVAGEPKN